MKTRWFNNCVLLIFSFVLSLLFGELIVRLFIPVRNVGPPFTEYDPYYGKRLKKSFSCKRITPEFTMRFTTNSLRFRGSEERNYPYKPILFLGDSFTMGYGVNDGEEFPALVKIELEKKYGNDVIPVVNAGIGDSGNGWWLKFLKREVNNYKPILVVMGFCGNDFLDNRKEKLFKFTEKGYLVENPNFSKQKIKRKIAKILESVPGLTYSYLVGLSRQLQIPRFQKNGNLGQSNPALNTLYENRLTYSILNEVLKICKKENIPVIALNINVNVKDKRLDEIRQIWNEYNVPFIDIPEREKRPDLYYEVDAHWNAQGHMFVAKQLMALFEDERYSTLLNQVVAEREQNVN